MPKDAEGNYLDPHTGYTLALNQNGKPRKVRVWEHQGTLTELWPTVLDLQSKGFAAFYVVNEVRDDAGPFVSDADITGVRALFIDRRVYLAQTCIYLSQSCSQRRVCIYDR